MTRNESFKRRVRARMAQTGEKYGAARRVLVERAESRPIGRRWVSQPEQPDAAVRDATGHGYDHWVDQVEAWPGHVDGHTAVVRWLVDEHAVDHWWAQAITVGWERITGRRLPHQMADGTFTANKSRTLTVDHDELRRLLLDDDGRAALFGGLVTILRSKPTSKVVRLGVGPGVAIVAIEPRDGGRARITVAHEKLPAFEDVAHWKSFWADWLAAIDEVG